MLLLDKPFGALDVKVFVQVDDVHVTPRRLNIYDHAHGVFQPVDVNRAQRSLAGRRGDLIGSHSRFTRRRVFSERASGRKRDVGLAPSSNSSK